MRARAFHPVVMGVLLGLVAGCGFATEVEGHATTSPIAVPSPSRGMSVVRELSPEELDPGRYTYSDFTPRVTLRVPDGWFGDHVVPDNFFDVNYLLDSGELGSRLVRVMVADPERFFGSDTGTDTGTKTDSIDRAVELWQRNPALEIVESGSATVDGRTGTRVTVKQADGEADLPIFGWGSDNFRLEPDRTARLTLLEMDQGILVVGVDGPTSHFESVLRRAEPVLDSVRIGVQLSDPSEGGG